MMTYSVCLKAENGFVSLLSKSGDIPDGTFDVSGHHDENGTSLSVLRRRPDGTYGENVSHSHNVDKPDAPADEDPF